MHKPHRALCATTAALPIRLVEQAAGLGLLMLIRFAGGSSVSIVGAGALEPHTEWFRLFYFGGLADFAGDTPEQIGVSLERIAHARSTP